MLGFTAAACLIAALMVTGLGRAAADEPVDCTDAGAETAAQAFEAYCGRCHAADALSADYFAGVGAGDMQQREDDLALFLNRHSACPHQHHEDIAAWLRQLAEPE